MDKRKRLGGVSRWKMGNKSLLKVDDDDVEENLKFKRDGQHLRGIFSTELWQMILEEVKGSTDLERCSNASPFFRELLKDRRVLFLFPKVVESLAPRYEMYMSHCYDEDMLYLESGSTRHRLPNYLFDYGTRFRNPTGVLKCRLVCSSWNKGVEDFYQGPLARHYDMWQDVEDPSNLSIDAMLDGRTWGHDYCVDPNVLVEHFENTHNSGIAAPRKNPLIRRSLSFHIQLSGPGTPEDEVDGIIARTTAEVNMLTKFGQEVWYCLISSASIYLVENGLEFYSKLREMLQLMPNLKALKVICRFSPWCTSSDEISRYHESLSLLEQEMTVHSFPKLDKLELLKTYFLPMSFFNEICRRNSHISMLELTTEDERTYKMLTSELLPNLKQLSMTVRFRSYSEVNYQKLMEAGAGWKLEKLYLICSYPTSRMNWRVFFNQLSNNWAATLTNLMLHLPRPATNFSGRKLLETTRSYRLPLPCLQRLKLTIVTPCSLDFLLPSKDTLKYLEVGRVWDSSDNIKNRQLVNYLRSATKTEEKKQIVEFIGYENRLLKSNIWNHFRKLKMVRISKVETIMGGFWGDGRPGKGYTDFMRPTNI